MSHVARRFEHLLNAYRREDGGKWSGIELERATGGVLTRSYVTNLRKGRIENPGMDKLAALAKAMGFPPALSLVSRFSPVRRRGKSRHATLSTLSTGIHGDSIRLGHYLTGVRNLSRP